MAQNRNIAHHKLDVYNLVFTNVDYFNIVLAEYFAPQGLA